MTNDYDKLRAMQACAPALQWIGDRTIEQAWRDCERSEWMCWLLAKIAPWDPRLRLAAADMAERGSRARRTGNLRRSCAGQVCRPPLPPTHSTGACDD